MPTCEKLFSQRKKESSVLKKVALLSPPTTPCSGLHCLSAHRPWGVPLARAAPGHIESRCLLRSVLPLYNQFIYVTQKLAYLLFNISQACLQSYVNMCRSFQMHLYVSSHHEFWSFQVLFTCSLSCFTPSGKDIFLFIRSLLCSQTANSVCHF